MTCLLDGLGECEFMGLGAIPTDSPTIATYFVSTSLPKTRNDMWRTVWINFHKLNVSVTLPCQEHHPRLGVEQGHEDA